MTDLSERLILIAGASSATGRAVAAALRDASARVILVGSSAERLAPIPASARYECDLSMPADVAALAARIRDEHGPIDGLVHLVGGWRGGHDTADWDWLEPRLLTTLRATTLAFHDDLTGSSAGRLVVIGSASAAHPTWSGANYSVLKSAADAWVSAIASGWRKAGTAAAVTLVVSSIGDDGTPPSAIAEAILPLWQQAASDLNGAHIPLEPIGHIA